MLWKSSSSRLLRHLGPCLAAGCAALVLAIPNPTSAAERNTISAIEALTTDETTVIRIKGSTTPSFDSFELFKPSRIIVDIAETVLQDNALISIPAGSGVALTTSSIDGDPQKTRFEFSVSDQRDHSVRNEGNDVVVEIANASAPSAEPSKNADPDTLVAEDIKVATSPSTTQIHILLNGKPKDYRHETVNADNSNPPRLLIDLNNTNGDRLLKEQKVGTVLDRIQVAGRGSGIRIALFAAGKEMFPFQLAEVANGLQVTIQEGTQKSSPDAIGALINQKSIEEKLPAVKAQAAVKVPEAETASVDTLADSFNFAGYKKERITVDFYKIDLHNVFRLIKEISGTNIIVDESVTGSLTLSLNDVPWDFALDIILNLKDLVKEERFNTIVIVPKAKGFNWPVQVADNLSFEADETVVVEQEQALLVQQRQEATPEIIKAKELVLQGIQAEKKENFESAAAQYEEAFSLWPENAKLANRIASINLVYLKKNPAVVHFAKKALAIAPDYQAAALNAAIALANMEDSKDARHYFDQAVTGSKATADALLNYAAFCEKQNSYAAALKLLERHDSQYGQNLHSMLTAARILDKNKQHDLATQKYKALLSSGFRMPPDLKKYINGRVTLNPAM